MHREAAISGDDPLPVTAQNTLALSTERESGAFAHVSRAVTARAFRSAEGPGLPAELAWRICGPFEFEGSAIRNYPSCERLDLCETSNLQAC